MPDGTRHGIGRQICESTEERTILFIRYSDVIAASYLSEIVTFAFCIDHVSTCVMHLWCMFVYNSNYYNILAVFVLMLG